MAPYVAGPSFVDEVDNLLGARAVATGGTVYKDFFSQHTPLMYYIMAVFARIGVSTVSGFRVCFYAAVVAFFVFIYYRYKKLVGAKTLLLLPVLFVLDIARNQMAGAILSDMVQAMALLVLYIEFYKFAVERPQRLPRSSTIAIALAIFFAVGTAFLSIYAVGVIVAGVVMVEVERRRADIAGNISRPGVVETGKSVLVRFAPLVGLLLLLLTLFASYFALNNALRAMVYQSFTFNVEVYSKYAGKSSPLGGVLDGLVRYAEYVTSTFSQPFELSSLVPAVLIVGNVAMCCYLFRFGWALSVATAMFAIYTGIRAYDGFHGLAYVMFSWFCVAYLVERLVLNGRSRRAVFAAVLVGVLSFAPTWGVGLRSVNATSSDWPDGRQQALSRAFEAPAKNFYLQKYVPPGGYFFNSELDVSLYLSNDVRPASRIASGLVPWFAEAYMSEVLADLEKNKPNVVFYDADTEVWGYRFGDYAQPLEAMLRRDYVYYPFSDAAETYTDAESQRVWIRKGLGVHEIFSKVVYATGAVDATMEPVGEIAGPAEVVQTFDLAASGVSGASLLMATYSRSLTSHLNVEFGRFDAAGNTRTPFVHRHDRCGDGPGQHHAHDQVRPGVSDVPAGQYYVRLTTDDAVPGNAATVVTAHGGDWAGTGHLFVNGSETPGEVNLKILD